MRKIILLAAMGLLCASAAGGTSPSASWDEATLERNFDARIHPNDLRDWMKVLAAEPNHVGSPHDKANAERILGWFKAWGWDAHIETFWVLYPTPISESLELVAPTRSRRRCRSRRFRAIPARLRPSPAFPPMSPIRVTATSRAPLVYVNYGMQDDYKTLERLGVSVKGKIVIARYGVGWRGLKPKLAQDHGAVGCIIYSDPGEGWLLSRRDLSVRTDAAAARSPTRIGRRYAALSGRSIDAGRRARPGTPSG